MTNPNNAIGTNGAFGGRTSVNAFNDVMGGLSRGILSGWVCVPNSGLTVSLGGNGTTRDVAIAMDNAGNKTSINNISNSPVNVTIGSAPGTNSRIDAIVAYVDNPPSVSVESTDNPSICGLIVVQGTTASSPVNPTEAQIRTAITADGASGTTAYYVVLAYVTMASGTTDITSSEINAGELAQINGNKIENNSIVASQIDYTTLVGSAQMPVASTTIIVSGLDVPIIRFGNVVCCSGSRVINSFPIGNRQPTGVTLDLGYRPLTGVGGAIIGNCVDGIFSSGQPVDLNIEDDGTVLRSSPIEISGATRIDFIGSWITSDPWPSS